jgi:zinc protease
MNKLFHLMTFCMLANTSIVLAEVKQLEIEKSIKKLDWNGIEVVFIEDARFPTYDLTLYFADGALSESHGSYGLTEHAFGLIDSGTDKLSQKEILEQLEFYGTEFAVDVTHEYSTMTIAGLTKDIKIAIPQVCSLLRNATFPYDVVKKELELEKQSLTTLVSSHQSLAERVFREFSLSSTPYQYPVSGKLKDLDLYSSENLKGKLNYFLNKVKKRIYLTGPKSALEIESILVKDCQLKGHPDDYVRSIVTPKKIDHKTQFVFVPVPDANQVQLRVGRFLNFDETQDRNLDMLASDFLGGGFTSKLMREVRTKRGLTYSVGSFISSQKQYGRAGISTFTKNETIDKLITVIDDTVTKIDKKGISIEDLNQSKEGIVGAYPFRFESNPAFLGQLLYLDHIGKPYSELFEFKDVMGKYSNKDVQRKIGDIFSFKKQVIFVLGDKSLEAKLKKLSLKYGPLKVLNYQDYL